MNEVIIMCSVPCECSNRSGIYLVGNMSEQILGPKLPSNRQVLSTFFYNLRTVKLPLRESARLTVREAEIF